MFTLQCRRAQNKLPNCLKRTVLSYEFKSRSWRGVLNTTLCDEVCQRLGTAGRWFSPGTPVSSINKTDCHVQLYIKDTIYSSGFTLRGGTLYLYLPTKLLQDTPKILDFYKNSIHRI